MLFIRVYFLLYLLKLSAGDRITLQNISKMHTLNESRVSNQTRPRAFYKMPIWLLLLENDIDRDMGKFAVTRRE